MDDHAPYLTLAPQPQRSLDTTNNSNRVYLGVIVLLSVAWVITLILLYHEHKPCRCPTPSPNPYTPYHQTSTPQPTPYQGLRSPGPNADPHSVLEYLKDQGRSLSGQAFDSNVYRSLTTPWLWNWNTSVDPPVGSVLSPRGVTYYAVFDVTQQKWNISSHTPS